MKAGSSRKAPRGPYAGKVCRLSSNLGHFFSIVVVKKRLDSPIAIQGDCDQQGQTVDDQLGHQGLHEILLALGEGRGLGENFHQEGYKCDEKSQLKHDQESASNRPDKEVSISSVVLEWLLFYKKVGKQTGDCNG